MQTFASRAGRWPLALTLTLVALSALAACSDEQPVAPTTTKPLAAKAPVVDQTLYVTNTSGGTEVGSLRWAAEQIKSVGGSIVFDSTLGGKTITLDAGFEIYGRAKIVAPRKGVTISGKDQFRLITAHDLSVENVTLMKGYAPFGSAVETRRLSLLHSTVQNNSGPSSAIFALEMLSLFNSTVSSNAVAGPAVEYGRNAGVIIDNSTIAFNAPGAGLGPNALPGSYLHVTLRNSIISNNGSPQQNCTNYTGLEYDGTNVVNDWSCADAAIKPSDPKLFPLQYNGGPNMTHAISHLGSAFNTAGICNGSYDQRYVKRDATCDVGAFEFNDFTQVTITIDPTARLDTGAGYALLTGTVKCTRDDTIPLGLELRQEQKVGKNVVNVHTTGTTRVACSPTTTTWARKMFLTSGAWQAGAAQATAKTIDAPEWVAQASVSGGVRLSVARK